MQDLIVASYFEARLMMKWQQAWSLCVLSRSCATRIRRRGSSRRWPPQPVLGALLRLLSNWDRRRRIRLWILRRSFRCGTTSQSMLHTMPSTPNSHVRANSLIKAFIGGDKGSRAGDTTTDWQQHLCFAAIYPYWRIESQQHRPPAASGSSEHAADL